MSRIEALKQKGEFMQRKLLIDEIMFNIACRTKAAEHRLDRLNADKIEADRERLIGHGED